MNKISKLATIFGIFLIILSVTRWWFMFYDPSTMVIYAGAGAAVCAFAYVYDWMRNAGEEISKVNRRLDAFTKWWAKQETQ